MKGSHQQSAVGSQLESKSKSADVSAVTWAPTSPPDPLSQGERGSKAAVSYPGWRYVQLMSIGEVCAGM